jgi:hypothetical protein
MSSASNLHILRIDVEVADFAKTFAESAVQRPIARGVVGSIRTCGTSALSLLSQFLTRRKITD